MDVSILPNQPLTHQSALRDVTQSEALLELWHLAHSFPPSQTCYCFTHFSFKPRGTELPLQECTHTQSRPSGLSLSKVKQMSL